MTEPMRFSPEGTLMEEREMRPRTVDDDHFFRVEVTVAACVADPTEHIVGNNMVDATLGFCLSMSRPPEGATDAVINGALSHHISPVLAGSIDEPMTEHSTQTGLGKSTPVRVTVALPDGAGVPVRES